MPGPVATAFVELRPEANNFDKQVSSSIGGIAKKAAGIFAATFVARRGFDFAKGAIEAARESIKIDKQTQAVIKSTGAAAKTTFKEVENLSNSIQRQTGISDEAVQQASNLLLTFTGVRNEVGKGNDIFNQATKIAVDMGVAMGTDAKSGAVQLGKALNDPAKGITALTRVGIVFTDQQKEQIETLVASGKTMDAQKIILAELNKEFGGSAAAQADVGDKLKASLGDLQETIGRGLLPLFEKAAGFLADRLPGAIAFTQEAFGRAGAIITPIVMTIKNAFQNLVAGFSGEGSEFVSEFDEGMFKLGKTVKDLFNNQIKPLAKFLKDKVVPVFVDVAKKVASFSAFLLRNIDTVKKVATVIAVLLIPHYVSVGVAATVSAGRQVAAWIATKASAIASMFAMTAQMAIVIARYVAIAVGAAASAAAQIAAWIAAAAAAAVNAAIIAAAWLVAAAPFIAIGLAIAAAVALIIIHWDTIKNAAATVGQFIKDRWNDVIGFFKAIPGKISALASGMWDGISNAFKSAINFIIKGWNAIEFKIPGFKIGPVGYSGFTLGVPDIPTLHEGGIFGSGSGASGEGLALLRNGEGVFTPEQMAALGGARFGPGSVVVSFNGAVPTEQQAFTTGQAVGRGIDDEMARAEARRLLRTA